jgi:hypothetical protein
VKEETPKLEELGASEGLCKPIGELALCVNPLEANNIIMNNFVQKTKARLKVTRRLRTTEAVSQLDAGRVVLINGEGIPGWRMPASSHNRRV